ncbi:Hypothetical protein KVN_LOCUS392 [uncultured virus]|nr:Hypothetical protein KVN_LOCUS392 [uncultured virus]
MECSNCCNCKKINCCCHLDFDKLSNVNNNVNIFASPFIIQQTRQIRPIQMGVSGGSIKDKIPGGCCGGTLGSLVKKIILGKTNYYILSNKHVLFGDIIFGRNNSISSIGDSIRQPGLIDVNCANIPSDEVAKLSNFSPVYGYNINNIIDASIALVIPGKVDLTGSIMGIGKISSIIKLPTFGLSVQKGGRTSGVTKGKIVGLNVTILVKYPFECGSANSFTAKFINQIMIQGINNIAFSKPGDSGSLIISVPGLGLLPQPVGLLFAGSTEYTFANPISNVVAQFGVSFVGSNKITNKNAQEQIINLDNLKTNAKYLKITKILCDCSELIETTPHFAGYFIEDLSQQDNFTDEFGIVVLVTNNEKKNELPCSIQNIPLRTQIIGTITVL